MPLLALACAPGQGNWAPVGTSRPQPHNFFLQCTFHGTCILIYSSALVHLTHLTLHILPLVTDTCSNCCMHIKHSTLYSTHCSVQTIPAYCTAHCRWSLTPWEYWLFIRSSAKNLSLGTSQKNTPIIYLNF